MAVTVERALTWVLNAVGWRLRRVLGDQRVDRAIVRIAPRWRRMLKKPIFIGVTGSAGKTTTKELLVEVLRHSGRGVSTDRSFNDQLAVAQAMMEARPNDRHFVAELNEGQPGAMSELVALVRPRIAIVTVIGNDHWSAYGSREAIAAEVSGLVTSLPSTGTAVLNADDELVLAMAAKSNAKVLTYGVSPKAELRAEDVSAIWPERLQMTVVRGTERVPLSTQLCGSHWVPSVLGAIGGGLAVGLSLRECVDAIARVAPFEGRMQPVTTPDGVTYIRDDYKAPLWTVDACFDFMKAARAKRKIIVIGTLSAYGTSIEDKYVKTAKRAQEVADVTIFVSRWASHVLKTRDPERKDALRAFSRVHDSVMYLNQIVRAGDLVLLKGTNKQDHLLRIVLARDEAISCWRDNCDRAVFCIECPDRTRPVGLSGDGLPISSPVPVVPPFGQGTIDPDEQVIVGLGNPEPRFDGTPHNVGYEVVDRLAAACGLTWNSTPEAWIARGASQERPVCLVKIKTSMNLTGAGMRRLSESLAFRPDQCILVYDDLDTPIGSIRTRLSGGAGGHRGVASILEAFQTDAFRRVKVGVGHPNADFDRVGYVLTPFDPTNRAAVATAISAAERRALEMVERHHVVEPH